MAQTKFKLEQIVYFIPHEEDWDVVDPVDYNLKTVKGEILGIHEETWTGDVVLRHYEVASLADGEELQVAEDRVFKTKKEAEGALLIVKGDRITQKVAAYKLLRDQLNELGT